MGSEYDFNLGRSADLLRPQTAFRQRTVQERRRAAMTFALCAIARPLLRSRGRGDPFPPTVTSAQAATDGVGVRFHSQTGMKPATALTALLYKVFTWRMRLLPALVPSTG